MIRRQRLLAVLIACASPIVAASLPSPPEPPCGAPQIPALPLAGEPPAIQVWHETDLEKVNWRPPSCTGWLPTSRSKLLVALAGSFRFDGTVEDLIAREGAISTLRGIRYWSATEGLWRTLVIDASALSGPDKRSRRADFSAAELVKGSELHFWEHDSRSGEIVYRMSVLDRGPDRAVIATENETPVRFLLVTLFAPGALQSVEFIARVSPGIWGVYLLTRTGEGTSVLAGSHDASYVNRAVALYRHLAGIPTDREPPAAR